MIGGVELFQVQAIATCWNASAELLGQRDDDAFGAPEVAEPMAVLVLLRLADEFGAVRPQVGKFKGRQRR